MFSQPPHAPCKGMHPQDCPCRLRMLLHDEAQMTCACCVRQAWTLVTKIPGSRVTGVEAKDVEVAKNILGAILSGHVEGMPGDDADMAEAEALEESRGGRR